jgi:hypothetical protein
VSGCVPQLGVEEEIRQRGEGGLALVR